MVSDANGGLNVSRMVIEELPVIPAKYPDGTWGGNSDFPGMEGGSNSVDIANNRYTIQNLLQSVGDVYATFHVAPGLDFKSDFGCWLAYLFKKDMLVFILFLYMQTLI